TGPVQVALAVGIAGLPAYARVIRAATVDLRSRPYILAAQAIGAGPRRVLIAHVLPNLMSTALSFAAISLSWAVLNGAALVFLGFGGDPATPDWGAMLAEGRAAFRVAPWIALPPGAAITLVVYAVNRLAHAWQESNRH
ncbi:MAG: ABC transporter permease, partial [Anaerolineae bacterium]|nr:ABC transporter permease [Anaerolineae bacterium]